MRNSKKEGKPFFVWLNTSRMHLYTRLGEKWDHAAAKYTHEDDSHGSGMLQHDHDIGQVLDFLKKYGMEDNTVVWYSTDNGPEHSSWPDGATTPFRGEKMTAHEGGARVISMLRWPGVIKPAQIRNGIQSHQDMFTSFAAAAGVPDVVEQMKTQKKQYIDGVNNLDYWTGKSPESARLLYRRQAHCGAHGAMEAALLDQGGLLRAGGAALRPADVQPAQRSVREL
ncbi:sulfatase-like hydrolase/transferase [Variovorax rhizosphaerae]|uniref:Sulfatase-like hydrolase/transferase n=1 Tax=Variovorax rhizosphaerae TaxID=1836200 RepID=A0ABU8WW51_9BURK